MRSAEWAQSISSQSVLCVERRIRVMPGGQDWVPAYNFTDDKVPYEVDSWTVTGSGQLERTQAMYDKRPCTDTPPFVDKNLAVAESRVSFPRKGDRHLSRSRSKTRREPGHRRPSWSPHDTMSLQKVLRRGFRHSKHDIIPQTSSSKTELDIREAVIVPTVGHVLSIIERQELGRFQLQWLESERRKRWKCPGAEQSLLYPLNIYGQTDVDKYSSPYPNE